MFKTSKLLKKIFSNFLFIFSSNFIAAFFGIFSLYFNTHALGAELYGVFALYIVSIVTFNRLFGFEMWQQMMKFGSRAFIYKDFNSLRNIFAYCILGEFLFSVLSFFGANLFLYLIYIFYNFNYEYLFFGQIVSLGLIFKFSDTAIGMLRLTNRFNILAYSNVFFSALNLIGSFLFWYNKSDFFNYIILFTVLLILQQSFLNLITLYYWKIDKLPSIFKADFSDKKLKDSIKKYSFTGWFTSTRSIVVNNFPLYIIGIFLDVSASGIYKFATNIASFTLKLSTPLQQAVFPEISKMAAKYQKNKLKKIILDVMSLSAYFILIVNILSLCFADFIVNILGGSDFANSTIPIILLFVAVSIRSSGFFLRPVILNCIGHKIFLNSILYPFIIFVPALFFGVLNFGIIGVCIAHIIFDLTLTIYSCDKINKYFQINLKDIDFSLKKFFKKV